MVKRGKVIRMDCWDRLPGKNRLKRGNERYCDLTPRPTLHRIGNIYYTSFYRRTKSGMSFDEIKQSELVAYDFAEVVCGFLRCFVASFNDMCIITTPRRRHHDGFHFASVVCQNISKNLNIPFYCDAVQCINRSRLDPDFVLLRPISERRVIVFDDIITTGMTLTATTNLLDDRELVLNIIGINNR